MPAKQEIPPQLVDAWVKFLLLRMESTSEKDENIISPLVEAFCQGFHQKLLQNDKGYFQKTDDITTLNITLHAVKNDIQHCKEYLQTKDATKQTQMNLVVHQYELDSNTNTYIQQKLEQPIESIEQLQQYVEKLFMLENQIKVRQKHLESQILQLSQIISNKLQLWGPQFEIIGKQVFQEKYGLKIQQQKEISQPKIAPTDVHMLSSLPQTVTWQIQLRNALIRMLLRFFQK